MIRVMGSRMERTKGLKMSKNGYFVEKCMKWVKSADLLTPVIELYKKGIEKADVQL